MYKNLTIENSNALKRFSHKQRFANALKLINQKEGDVILDYGTGDGYLLTILDAQNIETMLVGYEPVPYMFAELNKSIEDLNKSHKIIITQSTKNYQNHMFDKVVCFEVLEHLPGSILCESLIEMERLLKNSGEIIISVPIEVGLAGLIKDTIRIIINQKHENLTFPNLVKVLFGIRIDREQIPYISTHIGFNHKDLEKNFSEMNWKIIDKKYSPLNFMGPIINSQVFFVLSPMRKD
jgi:2-polyprenyl-3-methyl-5-hydroxy-6-metoxy-1,4-benzoquinol methylase